MTTLADICRKHLARFVAEERAHIVTRPCLRCRMPFASEGPHNRLCYQCNHVGTYQYAYGALSA